MRRKSAVAAQPTHGFDPDGDEGLTSTLTQDDSLYRKPLLGHRIGQSVSHGQGPGVTSGAEDLTELVQVLHGGKQANTIWSMWCEYYSRQDLADIK